MPMPNLSDKGLSIFAFAAYHELNSGERVAEVVIHDNAGHSADPQGVQEVQELGLAEIDGDRAVLTDSGRRLLDQVLQQIRGIAKFADHPTAVA